MSTLDFIVTFLVGVATGLFIYTILLNIAYRMGIVEYHGLKATHGTGGNK